MTADTVGGIWPYALELIRAMKHFGTEFLLVTMGPPPSRRQQLEIHSLGNVEFREINCQLEWMDDPWEDVEAVGDYLLQCELEFAPDLVHLNGFVHANLPWASPVVVAAHSCVLSWWKAVHGEKAPDRYRLYEQHVTAGLRAANLVIAPTRAMLVALGEHYGISEANSRVIPNGRQSSGLSAGIKAPMIVAAGRLWDESKNFRMLDRIAPRLPWPIRIAGATVHPEGRECSLPNIQLLGNLAFDQLAQELSTASIFAHPAVYEPFGLSVLEAALSGCALVLGDIPSLREVWGDAAIYVDPREPESVTQGIRALIDSKQLRGEMSARARRRALHFSATNMAHHYCKAYQELLQAARYEEVVQ